MDLESLSLRIVPVSIAGRYFLFAQQPPTVMMVGSLHVLALKLANDSKTDLQGRFVAAVEQTGMEAATALRRYQSIVDSLRSVGLGEALSSSASE